MTLKKIRKEYFKKTLGEYMGSITVIIIVFILAIVGIKEFLIVLAAGGILGMVSAIIQSAERRRENKYKQYYDSNANNQSYRDYRETDCESREELLEDCECDWQDKEDTSQSDLDNEDQIVNDMIVMDMMDQEERERGVLERDAFNWETDCESCEELLEDCECDRQDISREDISQRDWNDKGSSKGGTSFDNFGG